MASDRAKLARGPVNQGCLARHASATLFRMTPPFQEYRVFWREFRQHFETTGAVLPSSRFLASALSRYVTECDGKPRRILEVGPGTGAVTKKIVARMTASDRFELVELNESFVANLRERFKSEPDFQRVAAQSEVLHQSVEDLSPAEPYDLIISGLPLNNFSIDLATRLLEALVRLLKPGGTLSFFQYIAVRKARAIVSARGERDRLRGVGRVLDSLLAAGEIRRDWVLANVPPAYAHHVRLDEKGWKAPV